MENSDKLYDRIILFDKALKTYTEVREAIRDNLPKKLSYFQRHYRRTSVNIDI